MKTNLPGKLRHGKRHRDKAYRSISIPEMFTRWMEVHIALMEQTQWIDATSNQLGGYPH